MKTYEEVADAVKLTPTQKNRYVTYMRDRWAETEEQKCWDGYALEWANRFKQGIEYMMSDSIGRVTLQKIDKTK